MVTTSAVALAVGALVFQPGAQCDDLTRMEVSCEGPVIPSGIYVALALAAVGVAIAWATPAERRLRSSEWIVTVATTIAVILGIAIASHDIGVVLAYGGWPPVCAGPEMAQGETCAAGRWTPWRVIVALAALALMLVQFTQRTTLRLIGAAFVCAAAIIWSLETPSQITFLVAGMLCVFAALVPAALLIERLAVARAHNARP